MNMKIFNVKRCINNYGYMITSLKDENDIFLMQLIDNNKKMADGILNTKINYYLTITI